MAGDSRRLTQAHVVLDLTDVTFLDSTGIGTIVFCRRILTMRSIVLRLVCPTGPPLRTLTLVGLHRTLPVYPTLRDALRDLTCDQPSVGDVQLAVRQ
jgi:anti-anti-sigma factor